MNQEQEKFYQYILDKVEEKNIERAKVLLSKTFEKQDEDDFTKCDVTALVPVLLSLVKPENIKEVQDLLKSYGK